MHDRPVMCTECVTCSPCWMAETPERMAQAGRACPVAQEALLTAILACHCSAEEEEEEESWEGGSEGEGEGGSSSGSEDLGGEFDDADEELYQQRRRQHLRKKRRKKKQRQGKAAGLAKLLGGPSSSRGRQNVRLGSNGGGWKVGIRVGWVVSTWWNTGVGLCC